MKRHSKSSGHTPDFPSNHDQPLPMSLHLLGDTWRPWNLPRASRNSSGTGSSSITWEPPTIVRFWFIPPVIIVTQRTGMLGMDGGLSETPEVSNGGNSHRCSTDFSPQFKPSSTHSFRLESIWPSQARCLQLLLFLPPSEAIAARRKQLAGIPNVLQHRIQGI